MLVAGDPVGPPDALPELLDDASHSRAATGWRSARSAPATRSPTAAARGRPATRCTSATRRSCPPARWTSPAASEQEPAQGRQPRRAPRLHRRAARHRRPRRRAPSPSSTASARAGATARPSAASRWPTTRSPTSCCPTRSSSSRATASGRVRGFLHFVPVFGRRAVSLGFMRRDRDTPNGLTDFLVVEAARLLGERGIEEFSLNFAAFGRWLREPANALERLLARGLRVGRPLVPDRAPAALQREVRPALAAALPALRRTRAAAPRRARRAMWAEGQLPAPRMPRRRARHAPGTATAPVLPL